MFTRRYVQIQYGTLVVKSPYDPYTRGGCGHWCPYIVPPRTICMVIQGYTGCTEDIRVALAEVKGAILRERQRNFGTDRVGRHGYISTLSYESEENCERKTATEIE